MKRLAVPLLFFALVNASLAQLTREQKVSDFMQLAGLYAKNYGPYEWKRDAIGFDLLKISPFLDRINRSTADLDFYEICVDYVASLNDAHDVFTLPSDFAARLGFGEDIYDGKVLIDSINRTMLPATDFPFQIGDEVVSVDGRTADELIRQFSKYAIAANPRSTSRNAATLLSVRPQIVMPHAADIGDNATVVIRRQSGDLETFTIPWSKTGTPLVSAGPVPTPRSGARADVPWFDPDPEVPSYMRFLESMGNIHVSEERYGVLGFGALQPIFGLPDGFVQRLGRAPTDNFFSGTYKVEDLRIGFLRIPSFIPRTSTAQALQQFESEMAFFQENTDGLIIDDMRNPGGSVSYDQALLARVIPYQFRTLGFEVRATSGWVAALSSQVEAAKRQNAPQWVIDLFTAILQEVEQANRENRGRTGPVPLASPGLDVAPATDRAGNVIAYSKPLMVLVDEFSASGGDLFPAVVQDNQRGLIFGMRTMGAGGNVVDTDIGVYSEGSTRVTQSLMNRKQPIVTPEYPTAPYVENIGVRPDMQVDYMTRDNLLNRGKAFVDSFTQAMVFWIRKNQ